MPTPERKWERAARLYLMASDACGRGDAELAEMLVARGNQYADEAAAQAAQTAATPTTGRSGPKFSELNHSHSSVADRIS
jgi:hypothetical protein